jgi:hypothetical protein
MVVSNFRIVPLKLKIQISMPSKKQSYRLANVLSGKKDL